MKEQEVNRILGISESYKAPDAMMEKLLDEQEREQMFRDFLEVETDVSKDWFIEYFQQEQADRKSFSQDFTPDSVSRLLTAIAGHSNHYLECGAGSGSLLVRAWDRHRRSVSVFDYDPRAYWYHAEELSERALPFLIFNMSIRGMNGVVMHGDSLVRKFKNVYFIRNDSPDFLAFSEVIIMPKNQLVERGLDVKSWM